MKLRRDLVTILCAVLLCVGLCRCGGDDQGGGTAEQTKPPGTGALPPQAAVADPVAVALEGLETAYRTGDLTFGSQPDEAALKRLAAQGTKTVVSTRGTGELAWDEKAAVEAAGMRFVFIAMDKPVAELSDEQLAAFDEVMRTGARPMYLHCSTGNRTAGLWAAWLAERQGVAPADALRLGALAGMTKLRPVVEKRLQH